MIYVDSLRPCGAPWAGGVACHMISDESAVELEDFAQSIGLLRAWYQPGNPPHFDLSPGFRKKAIAAGAQPADKYELVAAMKRFREREPSS